MKITPCIGKPKTHRRAFAASRAVAFIAARKFMKLTVSSLGGTQFAPFAGQGLPQ
jgi:hypothetical protein